MIGYVVAANAERKPNLVMTEEERELLQARREKDAGQFDPWDDPTFWDGPHSKALPSS